MMQNLPTLSAMADPAAMTPEEEPATAWWNAARAAEWVAGVQSVTPTPSPSPGAAAPWYGRVDLANGFDGHADDAPDAGAAEHSPR